MLGAAVEGPSGQRPEFIGDEFLVECVDAAASEVENVVDEDEIAHGPVRAKSPYPVPGKKPTSSEVVRCPDIGAMVNETGGTPQAVFSMPRGEANGSGVGVKDVDGCCAAVRGLEDMGAVYLGVIADIDVVGGCATNDDNRDVSLV